MIPIQKKISLSSGETISSLWMVPSEFEPATGHGIIIAHGAGNDMHSDFVQSLLYGFASRGLMSVCFNFPYKEKGKRPPDRAPILEQCWRDVIKAVQNSELAPNKLFISGKSMGGRMATHIAASGIKCDGIILFGYPLHPPGKPEKQRAEHLHHITSPLLFLQGTRDSLCQLDLLKPLISNLSLASLHIIEGGDHSFKVLKKLNRSPDTVMNELIDTVINWMKEQNSAS